jgi:potassium-transporting ATPase KdpC subunit
MLTRTIVRSVLVIVATTVVFGFAYPAVMVGLAQAAFPSQANASLLYHDGHVVGSQLAAQDFTGLQYFHERPSATTPPYDPASTTFANYGPASPVLAAQVHQRAEAILKLESLYNPGLTISDIPVDAVTTSGSGVDPDISVAYAQLQARRVAAVRHLPLATVEKLIRENTTGRSLGVLGEPGVNVLELNLALDNLGDK